MTKKGGLQARDCLYLNWALPRERMPETVAPLRYDERDGLALVTTALYRRQPTGTLGLLTPEHPQLDVYACTLDDEGRPCLFLQRTLIPSWALPGARLTGRRPAHTATFDYPAEHRHGEARSWRVCRRECLEVHAHEGSPGPHRSPDLGSWDRTVAFFQGRTCGYYPTADGLRQVDLARRQPQVVPMSVEVHERALLERCLDLQSGDSPPELHSAWLCPEVPFSFERSAAPAGLPTGLPAPG